MRSADDINDVDKDLQPMTSKERLVKSSRLILFYSVVFVVVGTVIYCLDLAALATAQTWNDSDDSRTVQVVQKTAGTSDATANVAATAATSAAASSEVGAHSGDAGGDHGNAGGDVAVIDHPEIQFILCGELLKDTTLYNVYDYVLACHVNIHPGVTITIEKGTYIRSLFPGQRLESDGANYSFIHEDVPAMYVLQGGAIHANGTEVDPITFTTMQPKVAEGDHGLWGGLALLGKAPCTDDTQTFHGEHYGGNDPEDSSGWLHYVRIWYGGYDGVNAFTFAGVGHGTYVDHIEAVNSLDDGIEIHGGVVNLKYAASYFASGDAFKIDNGYQGDMQFVFVMVGTNGNTGLEIESMGDKQPRTHPRIRSATFLGNYPHNLGSMMKMHYGAGGSLQNVVIQNALTGVQHDHCYNESHVQAKHMMPFNYPDYFYFSYNNFIYVASSYSVAFEATVDCKGGLHMAHMENPQLEGIPEQLEPLPNGALSPVPKIDSKTMDAHDEEVQGAGFYETVLFAGAFDANKDMWLRGWTWLDQHLKLLPKQVEGTEYLCGAQKYDKTLTARVQYVLTCQWFVRSGAVLTLEPGTTIKSNPDASGKSPAIVVEKHAIMIADCTEEAPCTMSSNVPAEELPAQGKWGGLIVCGNAPMQNNNSGSIEGLERSDFGGPNETDFSGIYRYMRVWYAGHQLGDGHHVSALTFAGVGKMTIVEHIDVAYSEDNGLEVFGGNVDMKYISVIYALFDGIDITLGYGGRMQYIFVLSDSNARYSLDVSSNATDDGFAAVPRTHPQIRSVTLLGQPDNDHHALMDVSNAAGGSFKGVLMSGYKGFYHSKCSSEQITQAVPTNDRPDFLFMSKANIFYNQSRNFHLTDEDPNCSALHAMEFTLYQDMFAQHEVVRSFSDQAEREKYENNYNAGLFRKVSQMSGHPLNETSLDPRITKEAKDAMVEFLKTLTTAEMGDSDDGSFFEEADYIGAFDQGWAKENLWLEGWTWLSVNNKLDYTAWNHASRSVSFWAIVVAFVVSAITTA